MDWLNSYHICYKISEVLGFWVEDAFLLRSLTDRRRTFWVNSFSGEKVKISSRRDASYIKSRRILEAAPLLPTSYYKCTNRDFYCHTHILSEIIVTLSECLNVYFVNCRILQDRMLLFTPFFTVRWTLLLCFVSW